MIKNKEEKNIQKNDFIPSLFLFIFGTWLLFFIANDKIISGDLSLIAIGISYLILGIGTYGIIKNALFIFFKRKNLILERLDVIEKRLSAIEMMLSITYSPNYFLDDDKLYEKVLKSIKKLDEVSVSYIQRTFSIGYARAARIMDKLEAGGKIKSIKNSQLKKVIKQ